MVVVMVILIVVGVRRSRGHDRCRRAGARDGKSGRSGWLRDTSRAVPVVVVRLADTASCSGDSVDRLSHDSCSCGEEKESDLHLGDLVATVGCALKCWM